MANARTWQAATLLDIKTIASSYFLLKVQLPIGFQYQAGQHVTLQFTDELGEMVCHYSIASAPDAKRMCEFCVAFYPGSRTHKVFSRLQSGTQLYLDGPRGHFTLPATIPSKLIFIAGGSGISPLRAMIQQLLNDVNFHGSVHLLYGCQSTQAFPFWQELAALGKKHPHFHIHFCAEHPNPEGVAQGRVTDLLPNHLDLKAAYFICGPAAMVSAAQSLIANANIPADQIHFERY